MLYRFSENIVCVILIWTPEISLELTEISSLVSSVVLTSVVTMQFGMINMDLYVHFFKGFAAVYIHRKLAVLSINFLFIIHYAGTFQGFQLFVFIITANSLLNTL